MNERDEKICNNIGLVHTCARRFIGRGIEYDGRKFAECFLEEGIRIACGTSVRDGYNRTTVTWERVAKRILELLEAGTYLSAGELSEAQNKALMA